MLVCILSVVDDTKLITKVGFKFNKTVSCGQSRVSCVRFSNLIFLYQVIIRELQAILKELVLDKVSCLHCVLTPKETWLKVRSWCFFI